MRVLRYLNSFIILLITFVGCRSNYHHEIFFDQLYSVVPGTICFVDNTTTLNDNSLVHSRIDSLFICNLSHKDNFAAQYIFRFKQLPTNVSFNKNGDVVSVTPYHDNLDISSINHILKAHFMKDSIKSYDEYYTYLSELENDSSAYSSYLGFYASKIVGNVENAERFRGDFLNKGHQESQLLYSKLLYEVANDTLLIGNKYPEPYGLCADLDLGTIPKDTILVIKYPFTNTGKSVYQVLHTRVSCSCIQIDITPSLPVGETSEVAISFDSHGESGVFKKKITIIDNSESHVSIISLSGLII